MDSSESRSLHDDVSPEAADLMFANRGFCCCFGLQRRTSAFTSAGWWERIRTSDRPGSGEYFDSAVGWWTQALMKVREWSELVAGPRWKTFIRRFNKNSRYPSGSSRLGGRFQYDPLSYALNFDDGPVAVSASPDADGGFRDFSSRFAAPPISAKSSMDLGGRDAPPLFAAVPVVPSITAAVR